MLAASRLLGRSLGALPLALGLLAGCVASVGGEGPPDAAGEAGGGTEGAGGAEEDTGSAPGGEAEEGPAPLPPLVIGFNGRKEQMKKAEHFWNAEGAVPQPRLCHIYANWDVGLRLAKGELGDPKDTTSAAFLRDWFLSLTRDVDEDGGVVEVPSRCDEVMVSFKGNGGKQPSAPAFMHAMRALMDGFDAGDPEKRWGWKGKLSFTAWNEPNNGAKDGNGLGHGIAPEAAARHYLALRAVCEERGCLVAAGDFASNGAYEGSFRAKCAPDAEALCQGANYMDKYKHVIETEANLAPYHLGEGFRPEYWAYHGWSDMNEYVRNHDHCHTAETCGVRMMLEALRGSWAKAEIWDTETGVGQHGHTEPQDDHDNACAAAFFIRIHAISPRITRAYYTHIHDGGLVWDLYTTPDSPRPAFGILAERETHAPSCK